MTELLTAAQMRAIEQAAIASGQVTGLKLMERAGQGVVEAIFEEWPELAQAPRRAVVLCGPGNNGGDGFVVARLLKGWGWEVEVFLYGDAEGLPPDARVNYERWVGMGEVRQLPKGFWLPDCDFLIDALFGTGLSREFPKDVSYTVSYLHKQNNALKCVAIDVPSGLCADSGEPLGVSGKADLTVTFHRPKVGHYLSKGALRSGKLHVKDIGLMAKKFPDFHQKLGFQSLEQLTGHAKDPNRERTSPEQLRDFANRRRLELLALVTRVARPMSTLAKKTRDEVHDRAVHKYSYGHALILSGPSGRGGAARLAARGALRIGAGVVTVGCPPDAIPENAARLDAVMLREVADGAGLQGVLEDRRINALCLGPGMGVERAAELLPVAVRAQHAPYLVLDADALTAMSQDPGLFALLHNRCVLTPHAGEFARLFPDIAAKLTEPATKGPAYSKVDATREAAARAGCVVLFKGPDTVIATPEGRCAINSAAYERAAPWLATAGSGDVLAGFITGLLARGFDPFDAACTGAWLHVECARSFGPGLIAEDLPEELPKVFRALGL